jgi:adenylate cyclase
MSAESFKRKLTAILSADVKGYSRLMGDNEAETVKTLTSYRKIMAELIQQHRGRVIDSPGDNILAEFGSVVDAVQCSVAAQNEFKARNAELPENRRMVFRIGVNLGDVIEEEGRIYGDGVNIAARLEALAEPGGICISKTAFDHIETKLPLGYEYLGEKEVKNIAKPVGAYRVLMEPRVTVAGVKERKPPVPVRQKKGVLAGAVAVLILIIGVAVWNFYWRAPKIEPASKEKMAFPLPDKPSIAVLPFVNMSGDPKQESFSDALTEDIITSLSKMPNIFVIARNSSFTYKGKPVKVQQVAEDLGVRYVLEGSVQRSGDRVRITAQLIDALKGYHVWSERYDKEMRDVFALQDKITLETLKAVDVKLSRGDVSRVHATGTDNLEAYIKLLQGREIFQNGTKESNIQARQLFEEVIRLDPNYSNAYFFLAAVTGQDIVQGISKSPRESRMKAIELCQKAISLDDSNASAYAYLGVQYSSLGEHEKGIAACERAIEIAPNFTDAYVFFALVLNTAGRSEEAIPAIEKAFRFNPLNPPFSHYLAAALTYYLVGRYEEALRWSKELLSHYPNNIFGHQLLVLVNSALGRDDEARAAAVNLLRIHPDFTTQIYARTFPRKDLERDLELFRKAGVPDKSPLPLPDKPSIAILPFVNMSDDKSQEYFSDGLTEEIITALSKTPKLFVIARNSSFVYKGKPVNVQQVSRELGVKYVLEGSVRRSGDQLRITAQLIDATTGNHLWADRYDREMKDVFAVQDEITMKIVTSFIELTEAQMWQLRGRHPSNLQAYLKLLEGMGYWNESKFSDSMKSFEEALSLDPNFASTYGWIAWTHMMNVYFGPSATRGQSLEKAFQFAEKAKALDDRSSVGPAALGHAYLLKRDYDKALAEGKLATELAPNSSLAASHLGWTLRSVGRYEEAMKEYERALRLDPLNAGYILTQIGTTYLMRRRYEESISACKKALEGNSRNLAAHLTLAMAYSSSDKMDEARAAASDVLKVSPNFSVEHFAQALPFKHEEDRVFMADALRKAGLK